MGVILADQFKSMDWRTRNAEFICTLPDETVDEVLDLISHSIATMRYLCETFYFNSL